MKKSTSLLFSALIAFAFALPAAAAPQSAPAGAKIKAPLIVAAAKTDKAKPAAKAKKKAKKAGAKAKKTGAKKAKPAAKAKKAKAKKVSAKKSA